MEGSTVDALKDIIQFEERLQHNYINLKRVRQDILKRWRVVFLLIVLSWCLSKWTPFKLFFSCSFYVAVFVFVVLVGVTLRSGRWLSAEQFKQDAQAALLPFNLVFEEEEENEADAMTGGGRGVNFSKRVPSDLHRLLMAYRREYNKRRSA